MTDSEHHTQTMCLYSQPGPQPPLRAWDPHSQIIDCVIKSAERDSHVYGRQALHYVSLDLRAELHIASVLKPW